MRYPSWETKVSKKPGRYQSAYASIPNPAHYSGVLSKVEDHSYLGKFPFFTPPIIPGLFVSRFAGYSLTSGRFLEGKPDVWNVAGAPRGKGLHGTVSCFLVYIPSLDGLTRSLLFCSFNYLLLSFKRQSEVHWSNCTVASNSHQQRSQIGDPQGGFKNFLVLLVASDSVKATSLPLRKF